MIFTWRNILIAGLILLVVAISYLFGNCQTTIKRVGDSYVQDFAKVVSPEDMAEMNKIISLGTDKFQMAVVTIPTLSGIPISDYAVRIGKEWGVGAKGVNNGVVLLLATKDRKVFIATGYGAEEILTDARCKQIIEKVMVPYLKKNEFSKGLLAGTVEITKAMKDKGKK